MDEYPILIYQMGRVGSVALRNALNKANVKNQHLHYMMNDGEFYARNLPELKESILRRDHQWKVITLVRDPVMRNVSAFFRKVDYRNHSGYIPDLLADFMTEYNHIWPLIWFDLELKEMFGFDIYSRDFTQRHTGLLFDILVLKTEDLSTTKTKELLEQFTGVDNIEVTRYNATQERPGLNTLHEKFKEQVIFPEAYLDFMYDSKYARYFFTQNMRKNLKYLWQNPEGRAYSKYFV